MANEYRSSDWDKYVMDYGQPHRVLEPLEKEIAVVGGVLEALVAAGMLAHRRYDQARFLAHRQAVRDSFDIPWTGITPRMQRLLYAISAIRQPRVMLAAGIFCGNTFISNAGAAIGPGACYSAGRLIGVEIKPDEAARARRNVQHLDRTRRPGMAAAQPSERLDASGVVEIIADDAVPVAAALTDKIDLLYLDADGTGDKGKGVYLDILEAAADKLTVGALVLAHNSVNCAGQLKSYLAHVRAPSNFRADMNVVIDGEGLEITLV